MTKVMSLWHGEMLVKRKTMAEIAADVSAAHKVSMRELTGKMRGPNNVAHARQEAMWMMCQQVYEDGRPRYSYQKVGQFFGRDHSTVVHAVQAHALRFGLSTLKRTLKAA